MNWFAKNGDKTLAFVTGILTLLAMPATAASLGLNSVAVGWAAFGSAVATLAHTLYFPNSQVVAPSSASPSINTGKGS